MPLFNLSKNKARKMSISTVGIMKEGWFVNEGGVT
jgi:hypothetical protein